MEKIRVLIADDHVLFRDGLRALLASAEEAELVGEATSGDEAIALAAALQPDLILMDIHMPDCAHQPAYQCADDHDVRR